MSTETETHAFQADVNEVLSLVVNSLYSHKEIFLRELISNASDALDRLSFRALTEHDLKESGEELKIQIIPDKEGRTLTIRDNGVGLSHDELIENLGTIARSGSKELMRSLTEKNENKLALIGQFGVGFYSAYLVADQVTVSSRAAGQEQCWCWESQAHGKFTVTGGDRDDRGTDVVLALKEDEDSFLDEWTLKGLVRKYSDYVRYPIELEVERPEGEAEGEAEGDADKDTEKKLVKSWETINNASALWTRARSEIAEEQYLEFYKHLSHDWQAPLAYTHFKIEGAQELTGLLFLPAAAPFDMGERNRSHGVRLFVRRVFIMDDAEELLPEWLRFVRGVVDSADLPLNISREILQQDKATRFIRKQIVAKVLGLLEELAAEGETTRPNEKGSEEKGPEEKGEEVKLDRYLLFWREFGRILKEGVHYEHEQRERIAKLLRYESSHVDGVVGFEDYVKRMQEDQPGIFFVSAESLEAARNSPHIEGLRKRGYEILFMTDPVDEWVVQALPEFDGKKLMAAGKGDLELPESDEEKKDREEKTEQLGGMLEKVKSRLGDLVEEVRLTHRLTDSPACLVTTAHGLSPHMERLMRANGRDVPAQKRILELNPDHPVVQTLERMAGDAAAEEKLGEWSQLLFDQALLAEGSMPQDPSAFARSLSRLMQEASREAT